MADTSERPLLAPPSNIGMDKLDRTKFDRKLPLVVAEIENPRMLTRIVKQSSKNDILDLTRVSKIVVVGGDQGKRGVLLGLHISDATKAESQLQKPTLDLLKEAGASFKPWKLVLGYDYWTADEVLASIVPPELGDIPSGFSVVGHIAHLNLRDQFLPYKHLIGQVLLDKNQSSIKTVVNKLDTINSVYRTFDMEVIAGVPEFMVEQQESGCRFQFDFRKVYWNSRLHTEHDRLVQLFGEGHAICDPMAGVGPFAIPAAKRGNLVFANDLNPDSYESMKNNVRLNKLNPEIVHTYNEDGREFIRKSVKRLHDLRNSYAQQGKQRINVSPEPGNPARPASSSKPAAGTDTGNLPPPKRKAREPKTVEIPETFSHYVMNLPASAIEFLDGFRGLYRDVTFSTQNPPLPMIHVHCFFKFDPHEKEPERPVVQESIAARVSKALGHKLDASEISLHDVRRVAPAKDMYEVSFTLPHEVAYM